MQRRSFLQLVLGAVPLVGLLWRQRAVVVRPQAVSDEHFRASSLYDWMREHDGLKSVVRIDANGTAWWVQDMGQPASGQLLVQLADKRTARGYWGV